MPSLSDENASYLSLLERDIFRSETPSVAFDGILQASEHVVSAIDGLGLLRIRVVDHHVQLASKDVLRELDDVGHGLHVEVPARPSAETVADQDLIESYSHEEPVRVMEDGDVEDPLLLESPPLKEPNDFRSLLAEHNV